VRKITQSLIKTIQKFLLPLFLFIVYIFGVGITAILVMIFNQKIIKKSNRAKDTFWLETEGYEADFNNSLRQS
jgi:hypothetical protein